MRFEGVQSDLAWMPDRMAAKNPNKIFIMFGANALTWDSQMIESKFTGYYGQLINVLSAQGQP